MEYFYMPAPETILELVERFNRNRDDYRSGNYKEAQLRKEFIDPFFTELGWDMDNRKGYAEAYKDVIHEDSIKIGNNPKAPDYCFRIGGARKFFLEAKKPSVDIKHDTHPAYQLRRYAWSSKLQMSILTDFEEFAVYDCRVKPVKTDDAHKARINYFTYEQYPEKWDYIVSVFSREAVLKGSFDRYAETSKGKKGTAEVDTAFLDEIESWRMELARNIALRNPGLTRRELNFAVQRTIDRIIFLRICEDRSIEEYQTLQALQNGVNVYPRLCHLFYRADQLYNSGLFHFQTEKGRAEPPDELTPGLKIDDKPLKSIIKRLYYPDSPYEFSVLPADILGQVYEQFLGKVIRLTEGHRAVVEDKPEVKKAGGVFYTPTYIVDYIVKNTVGALIEGKTPDEVSKLRILDPACGSGSFLIGAYQFLLDWHLKYYTEHNPEKWASGRKPRIVRISDLDRRLTTDERKRILLNNIFGVDIDTQAVEVTKLSLLLKVLEGETRQSIATQFKLFRERALPDLASNIKCGNSLIGPDFYEGAQIDLFDEEEKYRINVFDWKSEFSEIFKAGGFDAVIGNPPWLMAGYYVGNSIEYLLKKFEVATGKFDLYYVFIEKSLYLLSNDGYFGMIVPNKFFHTKAASQLRKLLSKEEIIQEIIDFKDEQIFSGATNYSCILILHKKVNIHPLYTLAQKGLNIQKRIDIPWVVFSSETWHFEESNIRSLFDKLENIGKPLHELTSRFGTGVQSGADRLLMLNADSELVKNLENSILSPVFRGRNIRRYQIPEGVKLLIFPYKIKNNQYVIFSDDEIKQFKNIFNYLLLQKQQLEKRIWFGKGPEDLSGKWYGLMYLDSFDSFNAPHILTPSLSNRSNFTLGTGNLFVTGTAGVTSIIPNKVILENILYLLGILNSILISFYTINHSPIFSGAYYKFSAPYLKQLPIRTIDFNSAADVARHDRMVSLVTSMLELNKKLADARTADEKNTLQRIIDATDNEIDRLVYELYDLTEEEIGIVEGN